MMKIVVNEYSSNMEMELKLGQTVPTLQVSGTMVGPMVKESSPMQMKTFMKENSKMIELMDMELINILVAIVTRGIL